VFDDRVKKVIDFKRKVCGDDDQGNGDGKKKTFVIINQKGIDPLSLDALAKEGILALRRAKRRNMERMALACGGIAANSFDDLNESYLGYAGTILYQTPNHCYNITAALTKLTQYQIQCYFPQNFGISLKFSSLNRPMENLREIPKFCGK
jgi:chaperonin GroEL (HSP60 family)